MTRSQLFRLHTLSAALLLTTGVPLACGGDPTRDTSPGQEFPGDAADISLVDESTTQDGLTTPACATGSVAVASRYFVSTEGNDANTGTSACPFRTLNRAVRALAPGKTLVIRGGTYVESLLGSNIPNGTAGSNVVIAAVPGHTVIIQPRGRARALELSRGQSDHHHITFGGIIFDGRDSSLDVIKTSPDGIAHDLVFNGGEIRFAANQGFLGHCDHCTFQNVKVHDNGTNPGTHGFYLSGDSIRIQGCEIYRNYHEAIRNNGMDNALVLDNRIYQNGRGSRGYAVEAQSRGGTYRRNIIFDNNGGGMRVMASSTVSNNQFINNNGPGLSASYPAPAGEVPSTMTVRVEDNIFLGNASYGIDNQAGPNASSLFTGNRAEGNQGSVRNTNPDYRNQNTTSVWARNLRTVDHSRLADTSAVALDVSAGSDLAVRGPEPTVSLNAMVLSTTGASMTAFSWVTLVEPAPGAVQLDSPHALATTAHFRVPGPYQLRAVVETGSQASSALLRVFVYSPSPAGIIRMEAEQLLPNYYQPVAQAAASNGAYMRDAHVQGTNLDDLTGVFPGPAGRYTVRAGYFDHASGVTDAAGNALNATCRLFFRTEGEDLLASMRWTFDQDLPGNAPGAQNHVEKVLGEVNLQPGDVVGLDGYETLSVGLELVNLDYLDFIPVR